jgi:trehalose 6-phosphate phosphatase
MPTSEKRTRQPTPLAGVPRRLWRLVSLARHRLLMLDYDGTLAPFHVNRELARPLPHALELVGAIAAEPDTSVAVVSGRPLSEMERLLGPLPVTLVGEHGWEMRLTDGSILRHPVSAALAERLDLAERTARDKGMGGLLERKRTGLVFHTRGVVGGELPRELEDQARALWQTVADGGQFSLQRIDGGIELRMCGRNKGTVALSLVSQSPEGTLSVFVGDDVTDEDAFAVVQGFGFGVRVGGSDRPTVAAAHLPTCDSVAEFLEEWLRVVRDARGAADLAPPQRDA